MRENFKIFSGWKKIDEKEALELKKIYNHYLDKRKEIMKNTIFKIEDVFGDVISEDNFSQEQITKLENFFPKNVNNNFGINIHLFRNRKKNKKVWTLCSSLIRKKLVKKNEFESDNLLLARTTFF